MSYDHLIFERDGHVGIITFNRPEARNSLNVPLLTELLQVMDEIERDETMKVIIVTGGEKYFSAGFDLKQLRDYRGKSKTPLLDVIDMIRLFEKKLEASSRPVIAAICGPALAGGFEIAISCDIRIASDQSILGLPEIRFGGLGIAGATQRLPRMIPLCFAKELHFLGEPITAQEAYRMGLLNRVCENGAVLEEARKMAQKMALYSAEAMKVCKFLIHAGMKADIGTAMDFETELSKSLMNTLDAEISKASARERVYKHIFR